MTFIFTRSNYKLERINSSRDRRKMDSLVVPTSAKNREYLSPTEKWKSFAGNRLLELVWKFWVILKSC